MRSLSRFLAGALSLAVLSAGSASAKDEVVKEADVPVAVKAALDKKYPGATYEEFSKEDDKGVVQYEVKLSHKAKSTVDGKEVETTRRLEVDLAADGKILEEEEHLDAAKPPEVVTKALKGTKYESMKVVKVERVTKNEDAKQVKYEVHLTKADDSFRVDIDAAGKITRERGDDDDDEDDEDEDEDD